MGEREKAQGQLGAIMDAVKAADAELQPIGLSPESSRFILGIVEVLDVRGFEKDISEAAQKKIDLDWIEDLSEFPRDAILLAQKRWRRGEGRKRAPYASGELMELVKGELSALKAIRSRGQRVLRALST